MTIKCQKCGFTQEIIDSEVMDNTECILCGGSMLFKEGADYLAEEKKENITNETEGINTVLDKQILNTMINEIELMGEDKLWNEINKSNLELRLTLLPIFMEAKHQIDKNKKELL